MREKSVKVWCSDGGRCGDGHGICFNLIMWLLVLQEQYIYEDDESEQEDCNVIANIYVDAVYTMNQTTNNAIN